MNTKTQKLSAKEKNILLRQQAVLAWLRQRLTGDFYSIESPTTSLSSALHSVLSAFECQARMARLGVSVVLLDSIYDFARQHKAELQKICDNMAKPTNTENLFLIASKMKEEREVFELADAGISKEASEHAEKVSKAIIKFLSALESFHLIKAQLEHVGIDLSKARESMSALEKAFEYVYFPRQLQKQIYDYLTDANVDDCVFPSGVNLKRMSWYYRPGIDNMPGNEITVSIKISGKEGLDNQETKGEWYDV